MQLDELSGEEVLTSTAEKSRLEGLLSQRMFDSIEKIDIFSLKNGGETMAALLIFNSELSGAPDYEGFASLFIDKSAESLAASNTAALGRLESPSLPSPHTRDEAVEAIIDFIPTIRSRDGKTRNLKVIGLNYKRIIEELSDRNPELDIFALERETYKMYSSMLGRNNFISRLERGILAMIFLPETEVSNSTVLNQIRMSFSALFQIHKIGNRVTAVIDELSPDDGEAADRLSNFIKNIR